jgi:carboxypeptidase C (cathepsin A)
VSRGPVERGGRLGCSRPIGNLARMACTALLLLAAARGFGESNQTVARTVVAPLAAGDEPIVVTTHHVVTAHGLLSYEARAGRIMIRNEETGEIRGRIFFVSYTVPASGSKRPIFFAWNGGPTVPSNLINMEGFGPRRLTGQGMVDNDETLLAESDLVFIDPVETGFSRPEKPEFAPEFLNMKGDVATTAEFIRAYRARFGAEEQPLFVGGESYGAFRAAAVSDFLSQRGVKLSGTILISGDIPNIPMPIPFYNAMHVPARTATAFHYHKLPPELMKDREATLRQVNDWIGSQYMPALTNIDHLSDTERETIAQSLARYTGLSPDKIDRRTLVVGVNDYRAQFFGGDGTRTLAGLDTRILQSGPSYYARGDQVDEYLRGELGYSTDLAYSPFEKGYMPTPGPLRRPNYRQWLYNQDGVTPEIVAAVAADGEVTLLARSNPPWIIDAMRRESDLRVFVATGRFDPLNMCEGDVAATATLESSLSTRIINRCYEGGHVMYRDEPARVQMSHDLADFIRLAAR